METAGILTRSAKPETTERNRDQSVTWLDGDDLLIHASPLEWLQHEREGLVIVNFKMAGAYLRDAKSVFVEDIQVARKLRKAVSAASKPALKIYTATTQKRGKANRNAQ